MKSFSATIDLGNFDCCAMRRGAQDIDFQFWMHKPGTTSQTESTVTQHYARRQKVDELFWPKNAELLRQEAYKALVLVQQTMLSHPEELEAGEPVIILRPQLES